MVVLASAVATAIAASFQVLPAAWNFNAYLRHREHRRDFRYNDIPLITTLRLPFNNCEILAGLPVVTVISRIISAVVIIVIVFLCIDNSISINRISISCRITSCVLSSFNSPKETQETYTCEQWYTLILYVNHIRE